MHVALGGSERLVEAHRVADYMAYYRLVRRRFEERIATERPAYPPAGTYPEPVDHCDVCRWSELCTIRRRADDDLSLVAGIATRQRRALKTRGIATRRGLAGLELPLAPPLAETGPGALERVHRQARIQVAGEDAGRILHELIEPVRLPDRTLEPDRGLLSLPEPRPGDLFFDIEGDPFAFDDGLDYLFGVLEPGRPDEAGAPTFHEFWSRDADGEVTLDAEKAAFERLMDFFTERLTADPSIHIYHYAPYEPTALGRLMGRHATRELEVDGLFRGDVLVDLYRAVRQGVRASVESYSIKRLEPLYGFRREVDLRDAGSSIAAFEAWLQVGGEGGHDEEILRRIGRYNRDDVVSTLLLRDWLEARRAELGDGLGEPVPRPVPRDQRPPPELDDALARVEELAGRLTTGVPADPIARTRDQHGRWLLAQLLSWHRREEKAFWWRYFHLMNDLTDEERIAEREPIGGLTYLGEVDRVKRSIVHRYRFPAQEHAMKPGRDARDPATRGSAGTVHAIDEAAGTIDLKRAASSVVPHPTSLVPFDHIETTAQRGSLLRIGEWVADHGIAAGDPAFRAARDLLRRSPPRVGSDVPAALALPGEAAGQAAVRLAAELDDTTLAIQGPPGSGKTYTGARMIVELVAAGRRVGVTATSHKVIGKLLDEVAAEATRRSRTVRIGQRGDSEGALTHAAARPLGSVAAVREALDAREVDVVGGTAWVWAREEMAGTIDVLVVDEAGQISLANTVAVSPAARSLVLLGDPQQLDQPLQGSHPPGAERSALAHILDGLSTMPPDRGLFIDRTWRLHPAICAYTSEVFYEGRLLPQPGVERQDLAGVGALDGTGMRFLGVDHAGDRSGSPEEAERIARPHRRPPLGRRDLDGRVRAEPPADPRRHPGRSLPTTTRSARSPGGCRPGPGSGPSTSSRARRRRSSIYSMTTSSPEDAPRGMEFLYSLNRLNVATSRARGLSLVVASPDLIRVRCRTPRQMRLANALCRLVEVAEAGGERPSEERASPVTWPA